MIFKRLNIAFIGLVIVISFNSNANLIIRGIDSLGNQLIYDDDLDITWYDFTNLPVSYQSDFLTQNNWAQSLEINFNGKILDNWRLPKTLDGYWDPNSPYSQPGHDGKNVVGWNVTSSELGHLFYDELGGIGFRDTLGTNQILYGLGSVSPFQNLLGTTQHNQGQMYYWSETVHSITDAWAFDFDDGYQGLAGTTGYTMVNAIAVMDGDVFPVPEPSTLAIFALGMMGLALRRFKK